MKRTFKYALTAVLGAAIVVPAFAQDNFPDVPENHWAYEALARMKRDGLLVGYPDGLFRGGRPASRYELAVAIHATYVHLKNITDSLQQQIDALKNSSNNEGLQGLKDAIAALQNDVNTLKGYGNDIANLRRLVETFQRELQSLGVDVEAIKKDLADLDARVTALEKRKLPVDISGDVNLWLGSGASIDDGIGINKDGRILGTNTSPGGTITTGAGHTRDLTILHEVALTLAGTNETGPKWRGTFVVGNMLGAGPRGVAFGNQAAYLAGLPYNEGAASWYVQDLGVKFDSSVAGLAFNAEIGRVGYKVSPYIYQRPDFTTYYSNERWDDGMWRFDGGIIGFNFGGAKLDVFGGRNTDRNATDGTDLNPIFPGQGSNGPALRAVDRSLGANLNIPLSSAGNVNLAYLFLDQDQRTNTGGGTFIDRLTVFGGSADYQFGAIKLEGGLSQSQLMQGDSKNDLGGAVNDEDQRAWYAKLGYTANRWNAYVGYREVGAVFLAPGDWGRLGVVRNPVNIKGVQVGGSLDVGGINISASGEFDQGKSNAFAAATGLNEDSRVNQFNVRLGYNVNANLNVGLGYEESKFEKLPGGAADFKLRWTTFDLGYGLSESAKLMLKYEYGDHDGISFGGLKARGGFLTTQLSLKF